MSAGMSETIQKRIELLRTMVPKRSRVAVIVDPANSSHPPLLLSLQLAMQPLGWAMPARQRPRARRHRCRVCDDGVQTGRRRDVLPDLIFVQHREQISRLALKYRLPSIAATSDFPEAGFLMSYGPNNNDHARRAATSLTRFSRARSLASCPSSCRPATTSPSTAVPRRPLD